MVKRTSRSVYPTDYSFPLVDNGQVITNKMEGCHKNHAFSIQLLKFFPRIVLNMTTQMTLVVTQMERKLSFVMISFRVKNLSDHNNGWILKSYASML
jgi:hypothetical protein